MALVRACVRDAHAARRPAAALPGPGPPRRRLRQGGEWSSPQRWFRARAERSRKVVTVTNYTGKDREYLKKLILLMGGNFTPSMSAETNTIVVAA